MDGDSSVTLVTLLSAVTQGKQETISKLANIESQLIDIRTSMATLNDHIVEIEQRVSKNEDDMLDTKTRLSAMDKEVLFLKSKVDYLENMSRQSNLLLVGIAEGAEKNDPVSFVRRVLPELLGAERFPDPLQVERAHRISTANAASRSRPIIIKFLNFQDKLKVLRSAREKGDLLHNGRRVYIYPDYSAAVQARRKQFLPVKRKLQTMGIRYALSFPAVLTFDHNGTKRFDNPNEAECFVNKIHTHGLSSPMSA